MVRLGHQVADDRRAGRRVQADVRRRIAELSALSHAEWLHAGRPPYSVKGWLLANELSTTVGSRKMPAVAALLPALWAAIECGEPRWGSADRLDRLWALLRRVEPTGLPARASAGIGALLDRWQIDRRLPGTDDLIDAVCARALRAWGAGLPMLGGLRADDIRPVLSAAVNVSAPAA
jgi:NADP-dependent alcohol dehydrogenase